MLTCSQHLITQGCNVHSIGTFVLFPSNALSFYLDISTFSSQRTLTFLIFFPPGVMEQWRTLMLLTSCVVSLMLFDPVGNVLAVLLRNEIIGRTIYLTYDPVHPGYYPTYPFIGRSFTHP